MVICKICRDNIGIMKILGFLGNYVRERAVTCFTKDEVNPRLAKPPLKSSGGLAKLGFTSLVRYATWGQQSLVSLLSTGSSSHSYYIHLMLFQMSTNVLPITTLAVISASTRRGPIAARVTLVTSSTWTAGLAMVNTLHDWCMRQLLHITVPLMSRFRFKIVSYPSWTCLQLQIIQMHSCVTEKDQVHIPGLGTPVGTTAVLNEEIY